MSADALAAYQRALTLAVVRGGGGVPGVADRDVAAFAQIALRKRLTAVRALLPRTLAALGRAAFEERYRAFAEGRMPCAPERYRDEAVSFARSLGTPAARREARVAAAHGSRRAFALVREGRRLTLLARFRNGSRLHVVQLGR